MVTGYARVLPPPLLTHQLVICPTVYSQLLIGHAAWYWCIHLLWKAWIVVAPPGSQSGHPLLQLLVVQAWKVVAPPDRSRHQCCYIIEHTVWTYAVLISPSGLASHVSVWNRSRRLASRSIDHAVWPCVLLLRWLLVPPPGLVAVLTSPSGLVSYFSVGYRSRRLASRSIDLALWPCVLLLNWLLIPRRLASYSIDLAVWPWAALNSYTTWCNRMI